ncbi:amidohydrolase family protein [Bacteroidota bacterium]
MQDIIIKSVWVCFIRGEIVQPKFGDLIVQNGRISDFISSDSKSSAKSAAKNSKIIDGGGRVLTVPNINFHEHFYSRLAKGLPISGSLENFQEILKNLWWKLDSLLDHQMISASVKMGLIESLRNGVTYVFDHHSSPFSALDSLSVIANELDYYGLRGVLCFETSDRNGKDVTKLALKENEEFARKKLNNNIKALVGLHASFTCDDDTLIAARELIKKYRSGIHIHLSEDESDNVISKRKYNSSPVSRLKEFDLLNDYSLLSHGVHLSSEDYSIIRDCGCNLVYNIDSNLNNSVGLPDFQLTPAEIPIFLGTDGMHANIPRSFKQYFLLMRLNKISIELSFKRIKKTYFDQLRFIKKIYKDFSCLEITENADFIIWDYIPPTLIKEENFWGHYIYGILERPVYSVIQNGKILLHEFNLTFDDSEINKNIIHEGHRLFKKFQNLNE